MNQKGVVGALKNWCKINSDAYVAVSQVKTLGKSFQEEGKCIYADQSQVGMWYIPRIQRRKAGGCEQQNQIGKPGTIYVI